MGQIISEKIPTAKDVKRVADLATDIRIAMMTTLDDAGHLRSWPMATQKVDCDKAEIYFLARTDSLKISEVRKHGAVNLAYSCPEKNSYLSIAGDANLSRDEAMIRELWTPAAKAWFPEGVEDPRLCLITVKIEHAEYWDAPSGTAVVLYGVAKALLTGRSAAHVGSHEGLDFTSRH